MIINVFLNRRRKIRKEFENMIPKVCCSNLRNERMFWVEPKNNTNKNKFLLFWGKVNLLASKDNNYIQNAANLKLLFVDMK